MPPPERSPAFRNSTIRASMNPDEGGAETTGSRRKGQDGAERGCTLEPRASATRSWWKVSKRSSRRGSSRHGSRWTESYVIPTGMD